MPSFRDISGKRFGRLLAQWPAGIDHNHIVWLCLCDCGQLKPVRASELGHHTQSCGCFQNDRRVETHTTHGMARRGKARSQEYSLFTQAKYRAKSLGLSFDLVLSDIQIPDVCPLLNQPITRRCKRNDPLGPSVDRIIASRGYVRGNVWVISRRANQAKNDLTLGELETLTTNLRKHEETNG